ncbi:MAG: M20 family metallopeptidase [Gaiellales bacterium]
MSTERLLALLDDELVVATSLRRVLHTQPELGHRETATAALVADALGLPAEQIVGTGLLARVGEGAAPVVVRSELDGLPIEERTGVDFASLNGRMHACGHDVHMAALVALTRAVVRLGDDRPAPFWAVFQPSEEAHPLGAELIVESGVLDGARAIVAAHVHPGIPWGSIGADPGAVNAAADSLVFRILGSPGHGAYPHLGRDPILAMAQAIVGLHSLVGRRIDPLHPAVVNVGAVHAGEAANVIPAVAEARATLRTLDDGDRVMLREAARTLIEGTAAAHGCPVEIVIEPGEPLLANDPAITASVRALLPRAGFELAPPWRSCGSDDFSFFSRVAPMLMAFVGLEDAPGFGTRPLHHPEFLPPDAAVAAVARTLAMAYLGASSAG